jgi:hypothetical protein
MFLSSLTGRWCLFASFPRIRQLPVSGLLTESLPGQALSVQCEPLKLMRMGAEHAYLLWYRDEDPLCHKEVPPFE